MPYKNEILNFITNTRLEIVAFMVALFLPTVGSLLLIGFLIFADTLTGVWKSIKNNGWKGFKSRDLSDGMLPKLTMYPLILLIASGCESQFESIPFIKTSTFLLMCIELKSLIENFNIILKINLFTYLKTLIFKGRKELVKEMFKDEDSSL
tara:strand:+ start:877 stop:1329 length:453 start_codon:yes stop_codon:yes gene_type:complete